MAVTQPFSRPLPYTDGSHHHADVVKREAMMCKMPSTSWCCASANTLMGSLYLPWCHSWANVLLVTIITFRV